MEEYIYSYYLLILVIPTLISFILAHIWLLFYARIVYQVFQVVQELSPSKKSCFVHFVLVAVGGLLMFNMMA
jgi:hypothetical protein